MNNKLTDEELIFLMSKGDCYAEAIFYKRYYRKSCHVGHVCSMKYHGIGLSEDDYTSVAYSAVAEAVKKYKNIKGRFYNYWTVTVKNEINKFLADNEALFRKNIISLDETCFKNNESMSFHETLSSSENHDDLTLKECIARYIYSPTSNLTDDEALVAHFLFYRQYNYEEIMKRTGWKRDKTFYIIRNTRKKLYDYLKSTYFN